MDFQFESVWKTALDAATRGACSTDPEIPANELTHGTSLSLIAVLDFPNIAAATALQEELRPFDATQYWYPAGALHVTLHSIVNHREEGALGETEIRRLANAFRMACVRRGTPELVFHGVNLFPGSATQVGSIILQGFPNNDLLLLRDRVRQTAMTSGYPDRRSYSFGRGDYLTCTIGRLRKQPTAKIVEKIDELRSRSFGTLRLPELLLVSHSYFFTTENTVIHERFVLDEDQKESA